MLLASSSNRPPKTNDIEGSGSLYVKYMSFPNVGMGSIDVATAVSPKPGKSMHKSASPGKTPKPNGHGKHLPLLRDLVSDLVVVSGVAFQ
jgi:hypothetical protein